MVKEALHEGSPTFSMHCLPRWAVSMSMFCTPGIEIKNTTIQGRREGMSRNQKSQLARNLRNLASHLSWRPVTEFRHFEHVLVHRVPLAGQRFAPWLYTHVYEHLCHSTPTVLAYSRWHSSVLPRCSTCILYLWMFPLQIHFFVPNKLQQVEMLLVVSLWNPISGYQYSSQPSRFKD